MHLAIICGALDTDSAAGIQAITLANELTELGYRVTLIAMRVSSAEVDPCITLVNAGISSRFIWVAMLRYKRWLTKTLAKTEPDHTVSMLSTISASTVVIVSGTIRGRQQARQSLSTGLVDSLFQRMSNLRPSAVVTRLLERRAMSNETVQTFVAMSPLIMSDLAVSQSTQAGIEIARAALPPRQADPAQSSLMRQQLARAWGLNLDGYWIVLPFIDAQLDGFESMLRAFKPFVEQWGDTVLLLAGPTRYTHLAWIGQLGLRERIRFVGKTALLAELMAASDLVVSPTGYDPLGFPVMQAAALGKPTITTMASGAVDRVPDGLGCVLPAPVDPAALLEAIRQQHTQWQQCEPEPAKASPDEPEVPPLAQVIDRLLGHQQGQS